MRSTQLYLRRAEVGIEGDELLILDVTVPVVEPVEHSLEGPFLHAGEMLHQFAVGLSQCYRARAVCVG